MGVISGLASGQDIASNIVILGVFLIGAVVGIIAFSKFLHWLLARWNKETLIVLAGFIIGSLVKVWPWSNTEAIVCSQFPEVAALAEAAENAVEVSPAAYDSILAAYKAAEEIFTKALATGYADEAGNIYYYLFHCYYGQKESDRELYLTKAKETLLSGIKLFPKNNTILDGLMQFYTAEEGVGDPAELVSLVENSLKEDPTNYDLWFGRGRVFNALKNYDECVKSFKKCVELRPNEFEPNFYTGYFIVEKANALLEALNSNSGISYEAYEAENAKINLVYAEAIPWLEKAHEINPADAGAVDFLNKLCFRLRDMEGMMDKYNKYNDLLKTME